MAMPNQDGPPNASEAESSSTLESISELRRARHTAESASAAKSAFLSSMSHELRTPLNAILGFAQLLELDKKEPLGARHRQHVRHILDAGEHLLRLIDDVLDLSRIEAGGMTIATEPVDVLDVLEEVRTTLEPMASAYSIEIVSDSSELPMIVADRTRFAQILMNFGSNGLKYNKSGGLLTFAVTLPEPGRVRVTVSDNGVGIPSDKQGKLFQPFQRAGQETGPIKGTGMGLAVTKRLAELMGGSIGFQSVPDEGSDFWVEMPVHRSERRSLTPSSIRLSTAAGFDLDHGSLVLYVDNDSAGAARAREIFGALPNVELVVARSADDGLAIARVRRPNLIVLDIDSPETNSLALHSLRGDWPETASIPIIAVTAGRFDPARRSSMPLGFFRSLTKPLDSTELGEALSALREARKVTG
jgi:nitrogen-specific signal transduction histidine kinase